MELVERDLFELEPPQACIAGLDQVLGPAVDRPPHEGSPILVLSHAALTIFAASCEKVRLRDGMHGRRVVSNGLTVPQPIVRDGVRRMLRPRPSKGHRGMPLYCTARQLGVSYRRWQATHRPQLTLPPSMIRPGTDYHYVVRAVDRSGNVGDSSVDVAAVASPSFLSAQTFWAAAVVVLVGLVLLVWSWRSTGPFGSQRSGL